MALEQEHGVGRRKSAVARVTIRPGKGKFVVNGKSRDDYFPTDTMRTAVLKPFSAVDVAQEIDVLVNVKGGGLDGQADAVCLGLSRALLAQDEARRVSLRGLKLLTVDARVKERKKYGQPGARKKFQFVKR
jgi:small subunit ribosomal protein S9